VAIIVLFKRNPAGLITFGNRFRLPFARRQRGQFGESIYEIVLAATAQATKTGALMLVAQHWFEGNN
jgi:hypothetical protein